MLHSAISDGLHALLERDVDLDPSAWLKSDVSDDFLQVNVMTGNVVSYVSFFVVSQYPALFILTTIASAGQDKIRQSCPLYGRRSVRSHPPPHSYSAMCFSLSLVCTSHPTTLPCSHHEMSLADWRAHGLSQPDPTFHPLAIPRECGTTIGRCHRIVHGAVFLQRSL